MAGLFQILLFRHLKEKILQFIGDGSHTRSFQYIDDLIDGLIKLMDTPDSFTGPVNLGNPVEIHNEITRRYDNKNDRHQNQRSFIFLCPRMIRNNVSRIFLLPGKSWAGRRKLMRKQGWRRRLSISGKY